MNVSIFKVNGDLKPVSALLDAPSANFISDLQ